jgi:hypothetical protein
VTPGGVGLRRRAALHALALVAAAALAQPAAGHGRSVSHSSWEVGAEGASVRVRIPLLELTRIPPELLAVARGEGGPEADGVALYVQQRVRLLAGGTACEPTSPPHALAAASGWAAFEWRLACRSSGPRAIESDLLLEVAASHLHFARIGGAGSRVQERVLSDAERRFELGADDLSGPAAEPRGTDVAGYLALGVEHILSGLDHLAFVLALILLAASLREVASLVTGFTAGHSVTLALSALGWVRPDAGGVEALIGLSIALVAAENVFLVAGGAAVPRAAVAAILGLAALAAAGHGVLGAATLLGVAVFAACHFALLRRSPHPARLRGAVALAFGLVHGFGFAGVLAEVGLPAGRRVAALLGFNAGVEVGQLAVVALLWPALRALDRAGQRRLAAEVGSAVACGLGVFWLAIRQLG